MGFSKLYAVNTPLIVHLNLAYLVWSSIVVLLLGLVWEIRGLKAVSLNNYICFVSGSFLWGQDQRTTRNGKDTANPVPLRCLVLSPCFA